MISPLLKASDVAKAIQISHSGSFTLMASGSLPVVRFGGTVHVEEKDLKDFTTNNRIDSNSQTSSDSLENLTEK
jgi:hypothetical protein